MDQAPQEEATGWDHLGGKGQFVDEGESSLLVADLFTNQHLMIAVISCNLAGGNRSCCRLESSTIPRKVRLVAGPSDFSLATGMPSFWQTCSMADLEFRWAKKEEVIQVEQEGSSIVVLQDPMEGSGKLIEDARGRTEAKRKAGVNVILTTPFHA